MSEAALAILGLTAFEGHRVVRAWKGMDWDLLDVLFEKGWISDPKGKAKSVVLNADGARLAQEFLTSHERAADPSPVILWAGFNHLQQAQAIAAYYLDMKDREGWTPERLTPLLAGIAELVLWVKQWHNDPDQEHGERMGDYFAQFLSDEAAALGVPVSEIPEVAATSVSTFR
ncbi:MAG: DUF6429 family protein [Vicinamibacteria bacterium]